jgi:transposase
MPTYYLGLDVHKVRTQYCLVDALGEILREGNVPTEEAATLISAIDTAVVLEATGSWHATYDALVATGAAVKLAHPARIKAIASAKIKTDKIDARILAHLLRADLIPEAWAPPVCVRELRDLVRLRWRFISQRTTAKNRITNLLARENQRFAGTDLFGRSGGKWLEALELPAHTRTLVTLLLSSVQEADARVAVLTARLHELLDADENMQLLMTIPGVGFITAATLTAEVGDWSRFSSARQLSAYFGIIPSVRASAGVAHYGHITRAGSPHARRAIVEAAHTAKKLPGQASRQEGGPGCRGSRVTGTVLDPPAQRGGVSGGVKGEPVAPAGSVLDSR